MPKLLTMKFKDDSEDEYYAGTFYDKLENAIARDVEKRINEKKALVKDITELRLKRKAKEAKLKEARPKKTMTTKKSVKALSGLDKEMKRLRELNYNLQSEKAEKALKDMNKLIKDMDDLIPPKRKEEVKKPRGRPKKNPDEVKKPRGRPKKNPDEVKAPKKLSKKKEEELKIAELNQPINVWKRELRTLLMTLPIAIRQIDDAVENDNEKKFKDFVGLVNAQFDKLKKLLIEGRTKGYATDEQLQAIINESKLGNHKAEFQRLSKHKF